MSLIMSHFYDVQLYAVTMLQFETRLQKCIRMGITIFKIFTWGGISSDIRSDITFYGSGRVAG